MYIRKTIDTWELYGNYGYGLELLTTANSYKEAREDLKAYRDNDHTVYDLRIKYKREKKTD